MDLFLYIDGNTVLELRSLKNTVTGVAVTDAVVTATVTDARGDEIAGEDWPVTLDHIDDGLYRKILDYDLDILEGGDYEATVIAESVSSGKRTWKGPAFPIYVRC